VAASALAPLTISIALGAGFRGQPALVRLQGALGKLPWRAVRERAARWRSGAAAVDGHLARIGSAPAATRLATAAYCAGWLVEAFETLLILRLVGGPLDPGLALAAEVGVSLVRSVGNVAPAGLGLQDAGYAVLFDTCCSMPVATRPRQVRYSAGRGLHSTRRHRRVGSTDGNVRQRERMIIRPHRSPSHGRGRGCCGLAGDGMGCSIRRTCRAPIRQCDLHEKPDAGRARSRARVLADGEVMFAPTFEVERRLLGARRPSFSARHRGVVSQFEPSSSAAT